MSAKTCTIGRPGLDNPGFQWFSNLHCKSGALRVVLCRKNVNTYILLVLFLSVDYKDGKEGGELVWHDFCTNCL